MAPPKCRSILHQYTFFGVFIALLGSSPVKAGTVLSFPTNKICAGLFNGKRGYQVTPKETAFWINIEPRIETLAQHNEFIFENMRETAPEIVKKRHQVENERLELEKELHQIIRNNPRDGETALLKIITSENSWREKQAAGKLLESIELSDRGVEKLKQEINSLYGKMEIRTNDARILDAHDAQLQEMAKKDSLKKVRVFIGDDAGQNSKLFSNLLLNYIAISRNSSLVRFEEAVEFLDNYLHRFPKDGPYSAQPDYFNGLRSRVIDGLASTKDPSKIGLVSKTISDFLKVYPQYASETLKSVSYTRRSNNLAELDISISPNLILVNIMDRLIKETKSNKNAAHESIRFEYADFITYLLQKGMLKMDDPQSPTSEIDTLVNRYNNLGKQPLRDRDRVIIHGALFAISGSGTQLNAKQSSILFKLIQKLSDDQMNSGVSRVESDKHRILRDALTVVHKRAVIQPSDLVLLNTIATNPQTSPAAQYIARNILEDIK